MKPGTALLAAAPLALALTTHAFADNPARYAGQYYNPTNVDSPTGFTSGYTLFRTIGCPGKQLTDTPCDVPPEPAPVVAAASEPAPMPAPVAKAPPPPAPVAEPAPPPAPVVAEAHTARVLSREKPLVLKDVNFRFDRYDLMPAARPILDQAAQDLKEAGYPQVKVDGYTDSIGTEQYNLKLSRERADSVKRYLVGQGVPAATLVTEGHGETGFVASNKTKAGRFENRRVELHVQ